MATWHFLVHPNDNGVFGAGVSFKPYLDQASINLAVTGVPTTQSFEFRLHDNGDGGFADTIPGFGDMIAVKRDSDVMFLGWVTVVERGDKGDVAGWMPSVRIVAEDIYAKLQRIRLPIYKKAQWRTAAAKAQENPSGLRSNWRAARAQRKADPQTPQEFAQWALDLIHDVETAKPLAQRLPLLFSGIYGSIPQSTLYDGSPFYFDENFPFVADGLSYYEVLDGIFALAGLNWYCYLDTHAGNYRLRVGAWPADPDEQDPDYISNTEFADDPDAVPHTGGNIHLVRTMNVQRDASQVVNNITYTWNPVDPDGTRRPTGNATVRNATSIERYGQRDETLSTSFFTQAMAKATAKRRLQTAKDADMRGTVRIRYDHSLVIGRTHWLHRRKTFAGHPWSDAEIDSGDFWTMKAQLWGWKLVWEPGKNDDPMWMDLEFSKNVYRPVRFTPFVPPTTPRSGSGGGGDGGDKEEPPTEKPTNPPTANTYIVPLAGRGIYVNDGSVLAYCGELVHNGTETSPAGYYNIFMAASQLTDDNQAVAVFSKPVAWDSYYGTSTLVGGRISGPVSVYFKTSLDYDDYAPQVRQIKFFLSLKNLFKDGGTNGYDSNWEARQATSVRCVPNVLLTDITYADPPSSGAIDSWWSAMVTQQQADLPAAQVAEIPLGGIARVVVVGRPVNIGGKLGGSVLINGLDSSQDENTGYVFASSSVDWDREDYACAIAVGDGVALTSDANYLAPGVLVPGVNAHSDAFGAVGSSKLWMVDIADGTKIVSTTITGGTAGLEEDLDFDVWGDLSGNTRSFAVIEFIDETVDDDPDYDTRFIGRKATDPACVAGDQEFLFDQAGLPNAQLTPAPLVMTVNAGTATDMKPEAYELLYNEDETEIVGVRTKAWTWAPITRDIEVLYLAVEVGS